MVDYTGLLGQDDSRVKDVLKRAVVIRMPADLSARVLAREGRPRRERAMVRELSQGRLAGRVCRLVLTGRETRDPVKYGLSCYILERAGALLHCQQRASRSTGCTWSDASSCDQDCGCYLSMTCNGCNGLWICVDRRFHLLSRTGYGCTSPLVGPYLRVKGLILFVRLLHSCQDSGKRIKTCAELLESNLVYRGGFYKCT